MGEHTPVSSNLTAQEQLRLERRARLALKNASAPFSHHRVAAAVLGERGIYTGVNIESASRSWGICAEVVALCAAVSHGERKIKGVYIVCRSASNRVSIERFPCGACRQWMCDLAPAADIFISVNDREQTFKANDLLP